MPSHEKTRHKEFSLILPLIALGILYFFSAQTSLPVVVGINLLALLAILSSAFSVVRHADVLAPRLGEPYGSLILSLSVVILEVSLISALMATGDAAPALMRDTLYSIVMIVTGGGTIELRPVETGLESADRVEIRKGLSEGELVVTGSRGLLKPGQKVEPRQAKPSSKGSI